MGYLAMSPPFPLVLGCLWSREAHSAIVGTQEVYLSISVVLAVASPVKEMLPLSFLSPGQFNHRAAQMYSAKNKPAFYEGLNG